MSNDTRPKGIDCSIYQGVVDWRKVKEAGYSFAWDRISDGVKHLDDTFWLNQTGIREAGLIRGVYQYFRPGTVSTEEQVSLVLSSLDELGTLDFPPCIDIEEAPSSMTPYEISKAIEAWVVPIQVACGTTPILYTGPGFWNSRVKSSAFAGCPLWVADYSHDPPWACVGWNKHTFHQRTDKATVPGVKGGVDETVFNGTTEELFQFARRVCDVNPGLRQRRPYGAPEDTEGVSLCLR